MKTAKKKPPAKKSSLENQFASLWRILAPDHPPLTEQHRFHPVRRWRLDFAVPELRLAIEIEGGIFSRGRHSRGAGYAADCEKHNALTLLGWSLLRYTVLDLRQRPTQVVDEVKAMMSKLKGES